MAYCHKEVRFWRMKGNLLYSALKTFERILMYLCVCMCVWRGRREGEREREREREREMEERGLMRGKSSTQKLMIVLLSLQFLTWDLALESWWIMTSLPVAACVKKGSKIKRSIRVHPHITWPITSYSENEWVWPQLGLSSPSAHVTAR